MTTPLDERITNAGFAFQPGERALLVYASSTEYAHNPYKGALIHVTTLTERLYLLETEAFFSTNIFQSIHLLACSKAQMTEHLQTLHTHQPHPLNTIEVFKNQWDYIYETLYKTDIPQLCALLKMAK